MPAILSEVEECIPALRRYANALLRDHQDTDDLVHDTLVRALDALGSKRDDGEVRPWLFAIMHNLFVSQRRKARHMKRSAPLHEVAESDVAVGGRQEDHLRWHEMMNALNSLPQDQRAIVVLVSVESLSYAQVARVLDIPIGTVMSRLARGRERLRALTKRESPPAELRSVK